MCVEHTVECDAGNASCFMLMNFRVENDGGSIMVALNSMGRFSLTVLVSEMKVQRMLGCVAHILIENIWLNGIKTHIIHIEVKLFELGVQSRNITAMSFTNCTLTQSSCC